MAKASEPPTVDEYFKAATRLAKLVRMTFDNPKSVKRADLLKALKQFERIDFRSI